MDELKKVDYKVNLQPTSAEDSTSIDPSSNLKTLSEVKSDEVPDSSMTRIRKQISKVKVPDDITIQQADSGSSSLEPGSSDNRETKKGKMINAIENFKEKITNFVKNNKSFKDQTLTFLGVLY